MAPQGELYICCPAAGWYSYYFVLSISVWLLLRTYYTHNHFAPPPSPFCYMGLNRRRNDTSRNPADHGRRLLFIKAIQSWKRRWIIYATPVHEKKDVGRYTKQSKGRLQHIKQVQTRRKQRERERVERGYSRDRPQMATTNQTGLPRNIGRRPLLLLCIPYHPVPVLPVHPHTHGRI
jgi:hypothetical protein